MVQMQIAISDKHYQYLQQRARTKSASVEQILSELIEANLAWQQKLAVDPVRQLFAQLDDSFDTHDIDQVVYNLEGNRSDLTGFLPVQLETLQAKNLSGLLRD